MEKPWETSSVASKCIKCVCKCEGTLLPHPQPSHPTPRLFSHPTQTSNTAITTRTPWILSMVQPCSALIHLISIMIISCPTWDLKKHCRSSNNQFQPRPFWPISQLLPSVSSLLCGASCSGRPHHMMWPVPGLATAAAERCWQSQEGTFRQYDPSWQWSDTERERDREVNNMTSCDIYNYSKKLVQQSCKPHWAGPQSHQRYHRRRGQALSHPTCHDNHDLNLRTWAWASLTLCKKTRDIKTYSNIGNSSLSVQFPTMYCRRSVAFGQRKLTQLALFAACIRAGAWQTGRCIMEAIRPWVKFLPKSPKEFAKS